MGGGTEGCTERVFGLCLLAYVRYTRDKFEIRRGTIYYALALVLFALGLMSKPMLVTWPLVMLLLDFWPLNRVSGVKGRGAFWVVGKLFVEKIPFFVLSATSCGITFMAQRQGGAVVPVQSFPWLFRIEKRWCRMFDISGNYFTRNNLAVVYPSAWLAAGEVRWRALCFVVMHCLC